MKIFISWSGDMSKAVAEALYEWLPSVIQAVQPWLSQRNIEKGSRWSSELASQLGDAEFGIICLTPDNRDAPWIHFEAGALSKTVVSSHVCTFLLGLGKTDVDWPLAQFQHTEAIKKEDTKLLMETINKALGDRALSTPLLKKAFERSWQELETRLGRIPKHEPSAVPIRSSDEKIEEILTLVRKLSNESTRVERDLTEALLGARILGRPATVEQKMVSDALFQAAANRLGGPRNRLAGFGSPPDLDEIARKLGDVPSPPDLDGIEKKKGE
ncbi:MAG: toll/interleukin-1 receptor domain-containing protein [Acidobacteriia bacterium]|nr:toll/interleukin-1 receptor domain-containing protein [Terriglobia bacterium]